MLRATKTWHCECCDTCHEAINPGDEFTIVKGTFFKKGHPKKGKEVEQPKKKMVLRRSI